MRAPNQLVAVVVRTARIPCRTFANRFVVDYSTPCMFSTCARQQAGIIAFQHGNVTSLVVWTVIVMCAFSFWWLTSRVEGFPSGSWWARAVVAAHIVVAQGTVGAGEWMLLALVDVSAHSIWQESESLRADTETCVAALVHTFLVFGAWVGCRAVHTCQDAEVVLLPEWPWATTPIPKAL